MILASNLSPSEEMRINGSLSGPTIDALIDASDQLAAISGIDAHISEGMAQFPAEDFLSGPISDLIDLAKRLRGDNKAALQGIIESLEDLAQCQFNASDYGRDELQKAIDAITA